MYLAQAHNAVHDYLIPCEAEAVSAGMQALHLWQPFDLYRQNMTLVLTRKHGIPKQSLVGRSKA